MRFSKGQITGSAIVLLILLIFALVRYSFGG